MNEEERNVGKRTPPGKVEDRAAPAPGEGKRKRKPKTAKMAPKAQAEKTNPKAAKAEPKVQPVEMEPKAVETEPKIQIVKMELKPQAIQIEKPEKNDRAEKDSVTEKDSVAEKDADTPAKTETDSPAANTDGRDDTDESAVNADKPSDGTSGEKEDPTGESSSPADTQEAVPAWSPATEENSLERALEEAHQEAEKEAEPRSRKARFSFLNQLAEKKLPSWLARLVDKVQKMELPEKIDLPPWMGPINRMNFPNQLTLLRIVLIPLMMAILYWGFPGSRYVALLFFIAASVTDLFDGKIARKYHLVTDFGKFADPLADKMLVTAAMLWFVQTGTMPAWALLIVVCREFAVSGLRMMASTKGRVIAAGWSGKVKTAASMVCLILMFFPIPSGLNTFCVWVITLTTLYSGVEYFLLNRDVITSI